MFERFVVTTGPARHDQITRREVESVGREFREPVKPEFLGHGGTMRRRCAIVGKICPDVRVQLARRIGVASASIVSSPTLWPARRSDCPSTTRHRRPDPSAGRNETENSRQSQRPAGFQGASSSAAPSQKICTPTHKSTKAERRKNTVVPVSPSGLSRWSAKRKQR